MEAAEDRSKGRAGLRTERVGRVREGTEEGHQPSLAWRRSRNCRTQGGVTWNRDTEEEVMGPERGSGS